MIILAVSPTVEEYGADKVLVNVLGHFVTQGHEVTVAVPVEGLALSSLQEAGCHVLRCESVILRKSIAKLRPALTAVVSFPRVLLAQHRVIRAVNPSVIWINTIIDPVWALSAWLHRRKIIYHVHEIGGGSRLKRRVLYAPLHLAATIVAVSGACRSDLLDSYQKLDSRIVVVLNPAFGVQHSVVKPLARRSLVMIGRLSPRKGQHVLLQALALMPPGSLPDRVFICGTPFDSPSYVKYAEELRNVAAGLPIPVEFMGFVPTTTALELGAIVVVPSTDPDPCPLVVLEAMAAGRAVVASACGGIPEQLGKAGQLVRPNNPGELAAALASLLGDASALSANSEACRARSQQLSPGQFLASMAAVLDSP